MKLHLKIVTFFLLFFLGQDAWCALPKITKIRFSVAPDKVRLVLDASSSLKYTVKSFKKNITVNIKQVKLVASLKEIGLKKTPISSISSKKTGNDVSLILNFKKEVKLKHFSLIKPHRLVFDLYSKEQKRVKNSTVVKTTSVPTKKKRLRKVVIVIDPGHGGKDPGAVGYRGTLEKNINLSVAKRLQKIINDTKGFRAYLTRKGDYYVPLRKRLSVAHNRKANMFISIHADAYKNKKAHGASVFALSQRGATSEAARWLAKKENESELGQVISDKSDLLRSVLIDLAQIATIGASLEIGGKILRSLSGMTSLHSRRVEQAAFVVLKAPDVPSLLVEIGFLSHAREERKLRSAKHQKAIATKLAFGIKSYFLKKPPVDTYLAKRRDEVNKKSAT